MRETTLRKLAEPRYAVTLEPDEVAEIREALTEYGVMGLCGKHIGARYYCNQREGHEGDCYHAGSSAEQQP